MTARNVHALAATLRRLEHEAATGTCAVARCTDRAVGFVESWDLRPKGICAAHARSAEPLGYRVLPDPGDEP